MTEPDEDWDVLAFRQWAAQRWPARAKFIRDGELDFDYFADAFRAGAAASADREEELEARVAELEGAIQQAVERLQDYADMTVDQWGETVADGGITAWMVIRQELRTVVVGSLARAFVLAGWP